MYKAMIVCLTIGVVLWIIASVFTGYKLVSILIKCNVLPVWVWYAFRLSMSFIILGTVLMIDWKDETKKTSKTIRKGFDFNILNDE